MGAPVDHAEPVKKILNGTLQERIEWIQADAWVHTSYTQAAFQWMEYLLRSARSIRPTCLQLIGDPGMGKTATLIAFAATHPVQKTEDPLRLQRPVLLAQATPESSGVFGVRHAILRSAWPEAKHFSGSEEEVDETLSAQSTRMILLDELGEWTKCGAAAHRKALSELKRISNMLRINIVASTVSNLAHVLDVDPQFASRFKRKVRIPTWSLSQSLRNFVYGLERNLPFPSRSYLDGPNLLPWLSLNCNGNTKEIVELVKLAALHALGAKAECIELVHLKAAKDNELPPTVSLMDAAG